MTYLTKTLTAYQMNPAIYIQNGNVVIPYTKISDLEIPECLTKVQKKRSYLYYFKSFRIQKT